MFSITFLFKIISFYKNNFNYVNILYEKFAANIYNS